MMTAAGAQPGSFNQQKGIPPAPVRAHRVKPGNKTRILAPAVPIVSRENSVMMEPVLA